MRELGGPASLRREELDLVPANPGQVVVDVRAAGCNFFDILITQGKYQVRPELPFSPGAEVAGTVREVGEGVERFSVGDRVSALLEHGGFSSTVAAPQERVFPIPPQMTFEEAAALGLVYQTSYVGLVHRANLREGETLLVHAAAGGVGLAAVQLGVALGARVFGTAGTPDKLDLVKQNGADEVINYRDEDWVERVRELTDGRGADVIYDSVGGDVFEKSMKCVAWNGRIVIIGFASGTIPEIRANRIMLKNIAVTGLHWPAYREHEPDKMAEAFRGCAELYATGAIRPLVGMRVPLERVGEALAALDDRRTVGKLIVEP